MTTATAASVGSTSPTKGPPGLPTADGCADDELPNDHLHLPQSKANATNELYKRAPATLPRPVSFNV
ncbi:unnamed protein product, partial [Nesidiocoris tenuis]